MSEATVKTYSSALNHLVRNHSHRLAGVKVVYWYSHKVTPDEDLLDGLFTGLDFGDVESLDEPPPEEAPTRLERAQAQDRARQLLNSIRSGERSDLRDCRFYALTLSANSGRVVIRDWMEGPFTDLVESVTAWFEDLAIVARDGRAIIRTHKFAAVLAAPLRDLKDAAEPLVAAMWRAAIRRQSIPNQVMAQTLNRVRIDLIQGQAFRHARFGLLKAFCNREERVPNMTTELNDHETDPAYLCGRIMAILAAIQNRAMPGVGVGIVQRYYAAVSATPALILGRLIRTAQVAHLPKIESEGLRRWFENQLVEVWSKLSKAPPRVLTLEEQTLFAMGYYHQQANRSGVTSDAAEEQTEAVTQ